MQQRCCTMHDMGQGSLHEAPSADRLQRRCERCGQSELNVLDENLFEGLASFFKFLLSQMECSVIAYF